ncbi:hypothetical protein [Zoogloea sp.]|uniref:hypothetical protein n=1 Tax=Zoogloea sp. TaxID=49181 RepID=UPI00321F6C78
MYAVYAVKVVGGLKHRYYIGDAEILFEAMHMCNCCVCTYAYVKDYKDGSTVFYLPPEKPFYEEYPSEPREGPLPDWVTNFPDSKADMPLQHQPHHPLK